MTTDFLIDGMTSGTGVRDALVGGYVKPEAIGLSPALAADVADWQKRYEDAHFYGFPDDAVASLDTEGLSLRSRAQAELPGKSVGYFSNGSMKLLV